ncbi:terpenoid synthase [Xylariaceae sp. FL0662B]|nr:terpenoid synthase [Xylariaceae sp. FL0662B]
MKNLSRLLQRLKSELTTKLTPYHAPQTTQGDRDPSKSPSTQPGLVGDALLLSSQLKGQNFHLPDLWKDFEGWPMATNKHAEQLEGLVNSMLERIITNEKKLKALKQADFGRLMSLWYPDSEWEELVIAAAYSVWIFVWDDEVDAGDTDVSTDEEKARTYYKKSLGCVQRLLGLSEDDADEKIPHNMALFADVGRGVRDSTDVEQRQRFFRELENFMLQVGIEHGHRMRGSIPTTDKYLEIRSGSVGCGPQIALTEYMLKIRLPESLMESAAMKSLWKETIVICLILNDVFSVQKEIAQNSYFNLVPVMFKNCDPKEQHLDTVTRELEELLQGTMGRFEEAATSLLEATSSDAQLNKNIQDYIKWCRYFTTGVLQWSLESRRYGMAECRNKDGSLDIVL